MLQGSSWASGMPSAVPLAVARTQHVQPQRGVESGSRPAKLGTATTTPNPAGASATIPTSGAARATYPRSAELKAL